MYPCATPPPGSPGQICKTTAPIACRKSSPHSCDAHVDLGRVLRTYMFERRSRLHSPRLQNATRAHSHIAIIPRSRPLPRCSARTTARSQHRKSPDDADTDQYRPLVSAEHRARPLEHIPQFQRVGLVPLLQTGPFVRSQSLLIAFVDVTMCLRFRFLTLLICDHAFSLRSTSDFIFDVLFVLFYIP